MLWFLNLFSVGLPTMNHLELVVRLLCKALAHRGLSWYYQNQRRAPQRLVSLGRQGYTCPLQWGVELTYFWMSCMAQCRWVSNVASLDASFQGAWVWCTKWHSQVSKAWDSESTQISDQDSEQNLVIKLNTRFKCSRKEKGVSICLLFWDIIMMVPN